MEIKLKLLTPLWTGGVETGKMDRVHEVGILGSMRWWYEILVRGLGGNACDPTSDEPSQRCSFDTDAYTESLAHKADRQQAIDAGLADVCDVCRLFGCTGWRRRFSLSALVDPSQYHPFWLATLSRAGQFNHWWLSEVFDVTASKVYFGDMTLRVTAARGYEDQVGVITELLTLMARCAALGPKQQYGFGQFELQDALTTAHALDTIRGQISSAPTRVAPAAGPFYTIDDYWLLECQIAGTHPLVGRFSKAHVVGSSTEFRRHKAHYLPVSYDIRYKLPGSSDQGLRQSYRLAKGKMATRSVFGAVENENRRSASRVFVSHLRRSNETDPYCFRVWGFTTPEVRQQIHETLRAMCGPNPAITSMTGPELFRTAEGAQ